eukprot:5265209-Amphidinium_carterae.2
MRSSLSFLLQETTKKPPVHMYIGVAEYLLLKLQPKTEGRNGLLPSASSVTRCTTRWRRARILQGKIKVWHKLFAVRGAVEEAAF